MQFYTQCWHFQVPLSYRQTLTLIGYLVELMWGGALYRKFHDNNNFFLNPSLIKLEIQIKIQSNVVQYRVAQCNLGSLCMAWFGLGWHGTVGQYRVVYWNLVWFSLVCYCKGYARTAQYNLGWLFMVYHPPFCLKLFQPVSHLVTYNFRISKTYYFFPEMFFLDLPQDPPQSKKVDFQVAIITPLMVL